MMILIPKGNVDNQGIGMLGIVWKVVVELIDTQIKTVVQFHDVLHGFCAGRGAGTAIMELKLVQELASVDQDTLFLLLLELRKAYYNLYRGVLMQTLVGYEEGTNLWRLLE